MSTGNPSIERYHGIHLVKGTNVSIEQVREMSLSWFTALRDENSVIVDVSFSPEFLSMNDGRIWLDIIKGGKKGKEEIKAITGFSIEDLNAKKDKLRKEYIGQTNAPGLIGGLVK